MNANFIVDDVMNENWHLQLKLQKMYVTCANVPSYSSQFTYYSHKCGKIIFRKDGTTDR